MPCRDSDGSVTKHFDWTTSGLPRYDWFNRCRQFCAVTVPCTAPFHSHVYEIFPTLVQICANVLDILRVWQCKLNTLHICVYSCLTSILDGLASLFPLAIVLSKLRTQYAAYFPCRVLKRITQVTS